MFFTEDHMHVKCTNAGCENFNVESKLEIAQLSDTVIGVPTNLYCKKCFSYVSTYPCDCIKLGDNNG